MKRVHPIPLLLLSLAVLWLLGACGKGVDTKKDTSRQTATSTADTAASTSGALPTDVATCATHGLPASVCYLCDPSRRDPQRLWCKEHARYEDRCFLCHPELRDAARLYCDEHGLYEDECIFCHPDLVRTPASGDLSQALLCSEHHVPEQECGICHPELAERLLPGQGLKIRFPSTTSAAKAGIEATPVKTAEAGDFISAMGRLELNQNQAAKIASPVEGQVMRVLVDLGQTVEKGQVLLEINSPAWGEALAEEKAAKAALEREEALHRERVSSTRDLEEARARYEAARAARQGAGGASVPTTDSPESRLALCAPFSGRVVARTTSVGEVAEPGHVLIEIADLDPLWAMLSLPEAQAALIEHGDVVDLSVGDAPLASGRIEWIADVLDPSTRMVQVRALVPNPARTLRAGTFVEARIQTKSNSAAILIPTESMAWFGGKPFVFLELSPDMYEVRRIELSGEANGVATVVAGLHTGDRVVFRQSYLVKSEFQKSRLGAGCVD